MLPGHPLARHIDDFLADLANANGPVPAEQRSDAMQAGQSDPSWMLRGLGTLTTEVAPRIAPLLLLLSRAAETVTAVAQLRADLDVARLARMTLSRSKIGSGS